MVQTIKTRAIATEAAKPKKALPLVLVVQGAKVELVALAQLLSGFDYGSLDNRPTIGTLAALNIIPGNTVAFVRADGQMVDPVGQFAATLQSINDRLVRLDRLIPAGGTPGQSLYIAANGINGEWRTPAALPSTPDSTEADYVTATAAMVAAKTTFNQYTSQIQAA